MADYGVVRTQKGTQQILPGGEIMHYRERLGGEFDPGGVSKHEARILVLRAIEEHAPEVLTDLFHASDDVQLQAWAEKYNLQNNWFLKVARETLDAWKQFPELADGDLEFLRPAIGYFSPTNYKERQLPIEFQCPWQPEIESKQSYRKRLINALDNYLIQLEALCYKRGYDVTPEIRTPDHFMWLVLRKVKKMKLKDIADKYLNDNKGAIGEDTISRGINKAAKQAGFK